jgi:hypothetical protein
VCLSQAVPLNWTACNVCLSQAVFDWPHVMLFYITGGAPQAVPGTACEEANQTACTEVCCSSDSIIVWVILELKILLREGNRDVRPSWLDEGSLYPYMLYSSLCLLLLFLVSQLWAWTACYREHKLRSRSNSSFERSHQLSKWMWVHRRWAPMLGTCSQILWIKNKATQKKVKWLMPFVLRNIISLGI